MLYFFTLYSKDPEEKNMSLFHLNGFLKDHVTLQDWSNHPENSAWHHRINYIFKYIQVENLILNKFYCIFNQINASRGEQKRT